MAHFVRSNYNTDGELVSVVLRGVIKPYRYFDFLRHRPYHELIQYVGGLEPSSKRLGVGRGWPHPTRSINLRERGHGAQRRYARAKKTTGVPGSIETLAGHLELENSRCWTAYSTLVHISNDPYSPPDRAAEILGAWSRVARHAPSAVASLFVSV
jgi:hypothetical protein